MKNRLCFLTLAALAGLPVLVSAQIFTNANGNVGIGTTSPDLPLTIRAAASESEGLIAFEDPQGVTKWHINQNLVGSGPGLNFVETGVADGRLFLKAGGNFGIGTISPQATLDVNGDARANSIHLTAGPASGSYLSSTERLHIIAGNGNPLHLNPSTGGDVVFFANEPNQHAALILGNVGIGTTSPQAKLDVAGDIRIGGTTLNYPGVGRIAAGAEVTIQSAENNPLYLNPFHGGDVFVGSFGGDRTLRVIGKVVATTLELTSDRNVKAGLTPVDAREVLAKVAGLPIYDWHYTNAPAVPHKGPMAQDFKAAFGLGEDDKHISVVDGLGVALAAIQGLHEMVQEKDSEIAALKRNNVVLEKQLAELTKQMGSIQETVTALAKSMPRAPSNKPASARRPPADEKPLIDADKR